MNENNNNIINHIVDKFKCSLKTNAIKYLCKKGANINLKTNDGLAPLHLAAQAESKKIKVLDYLLILGADVNLRSDNGLTLLHLAAKAVGIPKFVQTINQQKKTKTAMDTTTGTNIADMRSA